MKQSLQLKIGQQLTMTPQLQQAIKLLQLSTLDLQQEIQQALESNPMLEISEETDTSNEAINKNLSELTKQAESKENYKSTENNTEGDWQDSTLPDDLPVDTKWEDIYQSAPPSMQSSSSSGAEYDIDARNSATETLQDHLNWQLGLSRLSDIDKMIGEAIIDAVDNQGRLVLSPEDIHSNFAESHPDIDLDEVIAVLHAVQQMDPPGVAAKDLQECLLIQLKQLVPETQWLNEALIIVEKYMKLLGSRDYAQLMRKTRLSEEQLRSTMQLIQSLNPSPGEDIVSNTAEYVVPDVYVKKEKDHWVVELNPDIAPRLSINNSYASLIKRANSREDNTFLKDHLQEARWFLKSLESRNETLMKVATQIVLHQRDFLEHGEEAMKPLVLHNIAEAVEMHESTISRVTTQKYMHTPRGIYELKYFFSSHVSTDSGGECSSTAIRAIIKKLIAAENAKKPLSDNKIAITLGDQGINVARRTVAKYRESMSIPPSNERKRLI